MKRLVFLLLACLALAPAARATVYRPGLMQVLFKAGSPNGFPVTQNSIPVLTSNIVAAAASDEKADPRVERVLYPLMDRSNGVQNTLTGSTWSWPDSFAVFAYEGEIFVEEGKTYTCYGRFDDGSAMVIDGVTTLWQGGGSGYNGQPTIWGDYVAEKTGWVPFNGWIYDWAGGKATRDCAYALQYNTNDVRTSFADTTKWSRFSDPGDLTFLRVRTDERWTSVVSLAADGADLVVGLSFGALPCDAEATVCYGTSDGGEAVSAWDATVSAGTVAGGTAAARSITLPGGAAARFVRVFVSGRGSPASAFDEWTDAVAVSTDPTLEILSVDPGYTNAVVSVNLLSLGLGVSSGSLAVEASPVADAFVSDVRTFPALPVSAGGVLDMPVYGLDTNSAWLVRARVVTPSGSAVAGPFPFRTLDPGVPSSSIAIQTAAFSTARFTATVFSTGVSCEPADLFLELSEDGTFGDALSFPFGPLDGPASLDLDATGLAPATEYAARLRVRNGWYGSVSETVAVTTRAEPFLMTPISVVAGQTANAAVFSIHCTELEPGAAYDVAFAVDGLAVRTFTGETATKGFSVEWSGATTYGHTLVVTVSSVLDGRTFSREYTEPFRLGPSHYAVTDLSEHASAATAFRVLPGDTITLPALGAGQSYRVLNGRFLSLEGNLLTALEPSIAGVELRANDEVVATMAVLVLPRAIDAGGIYVYDETSSTKDLWNRASTWTRVGADTNDSWPRNADDIAIIPFYETTGDRYLRHESDLSLGGLYFGNFRDVSTRCILERHSSVGTKTISFERTDGKPVDVKVCPNGTTDRAQRLRFGGYDILLDCPSPVVADSCSCTTNVALNRGFTEYSACTIHIPAGSYYALDGLPGYDLNMASTIGSPKLSGAGMFWKRGMGGLQFSDLPDFTGTLVDSSHGHLAGFNRAAPTFWHGGAGGLNVSVALAGWVYPHLGNPSVSSRGYGWFRTGWDPGYGADEPHPDDPWNPRKTMTLRGGSYQAYSTENSGWGVGVRNPRIYEKLVVGSGMSFVTEAVDYRANSSGHPINYVEWGALEHEDKGTLAIWDHSRRSVAATTTSTNAMTVIRNHDAHLVGQGEDGDCLSSDVYPIIPWIVAPTSTDDSSWRNTMFASFDADGRLTRPVWNNTALDAAASPFSNAYLWDRTIEIGRNVTLNSLFMNNSGKNKWLGAGKTLTITSGGLVLHGSDTAIGQPGRTDNGSLVLGDADHPGYVFAKSSDATKPNQIWADVTAPGGFVSSYSGALVLGGGQTNILGELVVNAGVLTLGTAQRGCSLRRGLDVRVCAGAELVVPRANALRSTFLRLDGAGGQHGTVTLDANTTCKKLYVRDWPASPEWEMLPRGTYGSSESGAANVRDDLFAGTGVLDVRTDDRTDSTLMIFR